MIKWRDRGTTKRLVILVGIFCLFLLGAYRSMIWMPGQSYREPLPPLTQEAAALTIQLQTDVEAIATHPHNFIAYKELQKVTAYLEATMTAIYPNVEVQEYTIADQKFHNLILEIPGTETPEEIIVVGAHYDSVVGVPGANDNGSGVASVLALARFFAQKPIARTLRFVAFANEEPPFFWTEDMGSLVYAKRCKAQNEKIIGMLSLETMGYYSEAPGSQKYPLGLLDRIYPIQGNFISFVGNFNSTQWIRKVIGLFRKAVQFPSEGAILPGSVAGVGWSDHWSFWQVGYPALMVTDTAPFRYPYYHTPEDTSEKINYECLARVVLGLKTVLEQC